MKKLTMGLEQDLSLRSGGKCELCASTEQLSMYTIPPLSDITLDNTVHICETCRQQIEETAAMDAVHMRCLNNSVWSETSGIKVLAWRMLQRLKTEDWAQDLLDVMYLEDEELEWAKATGEDEEKIIHLDSNGAKLSQGDTVVLVKDLNVKGANFTAKRGTAVRNIMLVADNPEHIEGRVNGQHIVILTKFVKKSN